MRIRSRLLIAALAAALVTPAAASAAWRLDPSYGTRGVVQLKGTRWTDAAALLPDGQGGALIRLDRGKPTLRRLDRAGTPVAAFGAGGALELSYPTQVLRLSGARALAVTRTQERAADGTYVAVDRARALDALGAETPEGAAWTTALSVGDRIDLTHWLLPRDAHHVLDLAASDHGPVLIRTLSDDGGATPDPWHAVPWPSALPAILHPAAPPIRSGDRVLVVVPPTSASRRVLIAITPDGRLDRRWGRNGLTAVAGVRQMLPWRGGAILISANRATWVDRRGRIVARRAVRITAAAADPAGHLIVARQDGGGYDAISLVRYDAHHRLDRAFGRLRLRVKGKVRLVDVMAAPDGRVTVLGQPGAFETIEDIREDFVDWVGRGIALWRVRPR